MRTHTVIYPGTFDPITNGHVDLAERAALLFDKVVVAIAYSEKKTPLFNLEERVALCEASLAHLDNIEVTGFTGLTTDFAQSQGARCVLRGLRAVADFEYELQMAHTNRTLASDVETVFTISAVEWSFVSARLLKEALQMGADISHFLPPEIEKAMQERMKERMG